MRLGKRSAPYWWLAGAALLATTVSATVWILGASNAIGGAETEAHRQVDRLSVNGYSRLLVQDQSHPGTTETTADYLGPVKPQNAGLLVSGPGVTITHVGPPSYITPQPHDLFETVALGQIGSGCTFTVAQFRKSQTAPEEWHLSDAQISELRSGQLAAIEVSVGCGQG